MSRERAFALAEAQEVVDLLTRPDSDTPTTDEVARALATAQEVKATADEWIGELQPELFARLGEGRHTVAGVLWELSESVSRTGWRNDVLRADVLAWARVDSATGEALDAAAALEKLSALVTISGSSVKAGQLHSALGRRVDEYATVTYKPRAKPLGATSDEQHD